MPRVRRRELRHQVLQALREHLELPAGSAFTAGDGQHAADLADVMWLDLEPEQARRVFHEMELSDAAEVVAEAEEPLQERLLEGAEPEFVGKLLGDLSYDDGTDLLEVLPEELRLEVMCFVTPEDAAELRHLSEYAPDTAGGMMTTNFLTAHPEENIGDVLKRIKRDEGEAESIHVVFVIDDRDALVGVLSTRELIEAGIHDTVGEIMIPDVIHARVDEDKEDVAHRILHYNLSVIPVLDPRNEVVGIVTSDDALEVMEDEGSEDALLLAGAHGGSDAGEPLGRMVAHRAPMLAVPVIAGLVMARFMDSFSSSPDEDATTFQSIVSYVPMALALSGTVGMQTSAVLVRGFAVGQIMHGRRMSVFLGEVRVGIALGLLCGLVAIPAMSFLIGSFATGMGMGFALVAAVAWSATASSAIAMGSEAAGLDPALVSGPVMIAVSDLSSVVLFLGMASWMLTPA
ncbi:MAG: magnesium transporter [Planctomycetota bacterium]|jgi:magnesium transporter